MDILLILVVVLVIVVALRGPAMLPKLGQALGRGVKEGRDEIGGALKDDPSASGEKPAS